MSASRCIPQTFHFCCLLPRSSVTNTTSKPACIPISLHRRPAVRFVATARRTTKALRVKHAPSASPSSKRSVPVNDHIVFNPPPTIPSPYHTPPLFLPPTDSRRVLSSQSHAHNNPYAASWSSTTAASRQATSLPPPIKAPREKTYHLTAADIAEIRRLRALDPWVNTRQKLAEKFGCTEFFVGMCAPNQERVEWHQQKLEAAKARWGPRRANAREDRQKRRLIWGRDE